MTPRILRTGLMTIVAMSVISGGLYAQRGGGRQGRGGPAATGGPAANAPRSTFRGYTNPPGPGRRDGIGNGAVIVRPSPRVFVPQPYFGYPSYGWVNPIYTQPVYAEPVSPPAPDPNQANLMYQIQRLNDEIDQLRREQSQAVREPLPPSPVADTPAAPEPPPQPRVVVFRDGHSLSVLNYAIVGQNLWVLDGGASRKIAFAELDLKATQQENPGMRFLPKQ